MKDPYAVLGINRNATDDEVKTAYRELARKYHPDNFVDNPLSDLASEKMQEINNAYDEIMNARRSGHKSKQSGFNANGGSGNYADIRAYIQQNRFDDAQSLLDGVPIERRDAEWYYLNGVVLYRRGWFVDAYTSFSTACRMDPGNPEYRNAYNAASRNRGGFGAGGYSGFGGGSNECSACDVCQGLICADCCCECLGGDLIRCC